MLNSASQAVDLEELRQRLAKLGVKIDGGNACVQIMDQDVCSADWESHLERQASKGTQMNKGRITCKRFLIGSTSDIQYGHAACNSILFLFHNQFSMMYAENMRLWSGRSEHIIPNMHMTCCLCWCFAMKNEHASGILLAYQEQCRCCELAGKMQQSSAGPSEAASTGSQRQRRAAA